MSYRDTNTVELDRGSVTRSASSPEMQCAASKSRSSLSTNPVRAERGLARWLWAVVAGLLATYAGLSFTAGLSKGVSFDEGLQLAVGYNLWLNRDFRLEGANGDLVKRWATLPYLISQPKFVDRNDSAWKSASAYELGRRFLFEVGNRPESLLWQGRAMIVLIGVATCLLVFRESSQLFGKRGGLLSLMLVTFSPSMLAFGGIVSTDMSITLTLLASTCSIWGLLHAITWKRLAVSLVALGLLVLAKPSALAIVPIGLVLAAVKVAAGRAVKASWCGRTWQIESRSAQAGLFLMLALLHVVAGWAAIWAHYDFRYEASCNPADVTLAFHQPFTTDEVPNVLVALMTWLERTHFLPEGFRVGIDALLHCDDGLGAFMNGEWKVGGWWYFFPYTIAVKTPPTVFALLVMGGAVWMWERRRKQIRLSQQERTWAARAPAFYAATPHLTLIGCYMAIAMTEDLNIGHRHVLPIYPSLFVLAGAAILAWRSLVWLGVISLLGLIWLAADSLRIWPHYLAYFAPQAGGAANGYKRLVDSSVDWGMDLPELKRWLDARDPAQREPLFLAYFGSDSPRHYGLKPQRLPGYFDSRPLEYYPLAPGYYAISATLLQAVYTAAFGPWNKKYEQLYQSSMQNAVAFKESAANPGVRAQLLKQAPLEFWICQVDLFDNLRFARLCAWLRHHGPPLDHAGHTIFIWKLDYAELKAALIDAPVELVESPVAVVRQFRHFKIRQMAGN